MFPDLCQMRSNLKRKEALPITVIVTGSGDVDPSHKLFKDNSYRTIIYTTSRGETAFRARAEVQGVSDLFGPSSHCEVRVCEEPSGDGKRVSWQGMMKELRENDGVRFLDVSAGGVVIADLLHEKLIDEVRATIAGHFIGPFSSAGVERPAIFTPGTTKCFTHEDNPILVNEGIRALGRHLIFLRSTVTYRH